jgi:hypothetical protein
VTAEPKRRLSHSARERPPRDQEFQTAALLKQEPLHIAKSASTRDFRLRSISLQPSDGSGQEQVCDLESAKSMRQLCQSSREKGLVFVVGVCLLLDHHTMQACGDSRLLVKQILESKAWVEKEITSSATISTGLSKLPHIILILIV